MSRSSIVPLSCSSAQDGVAHPLKSPLQKARRVPSLYVYTPVVSNHFEFDSPYRLVPSTQPKSFLTLTPLSVYSATNEYGHGGGTESQPTVMYTNLFHSSASAPGALQGQSQDCLPSYELPPNRYCNGPSNGSRTASQANPAPCCPPTSIDVESDRLKAVRKWAEEEVWADRIMVPRNPNFKILTVNRHTISLNSSMVSAPTQSEIDFCEWLVDAVWNELRGGYVLKSGERIAEAQLPPSYHRRDEDLARCYARLKHFASTWLPYHLPKKYRDYNLAHIFDLRALPLGAAVWSYEERVGPCRPSMPRNIKTTRELIYGRGEAYTDFDHYADVSALRLIAYLMAIHFTSEQNRYEGVGMEEVFGCGLLQQVLGMSVRQIATGAQILRWAMPDQPEKGIEYTSPWESCFDAPAAPAHLRQTA
ncbi:hypothetical protein M407DRAFT_21617 [Tulasnella calospora MUT 4182]|uniref:Uncharacterized protein n=1 Tax=Tulasnella calospora MUT 4182 TaxID=1051891 RepID=A0A0C3QMS0_9AGAM|nr:hypothetical protein M407DRAFT_21617 [Tulasnella calospora MUT 4182]